MFIVDVDGREWLTDGHDFGVFADAAPELLEACKAMVAELEERCLALGWKSVEQYRESHADEDGWFGQARAAIAKAEGGA
jgi:hypothetical protein